MYDHHHWRIQRLDDTYELNLIALNSPDGATQCHFQALFVVMTYGTQEKNYSLSAAKRHT